MRRIAAIIRKEFKQIHADPLMSKLIVAPVILQLFVMGYALTTEVRHIPFSLCDMDRSSVTRSLAASVEAQTELFDNRGRSASPAELEHRIFAGEVKASLVLPNHFGRDLAEGRARAGIIVDGQDANSANVSVGYLSAIAANWLSAVVRSQGLAAVPDVRVQDCILYNPLLKSSWYMIPGLVVLLVTIVTALLTGLSLVKEKESGTLEQLMVSPVSTAEVLAGKVIPFAIIGFVELMLVMPLGCFWFGVPFRGSVLTVMVLAALYLVSSLGIGILTSAIARSSQQVLFLVWFILIFFILLSGFFIPVENMPSWVQMITNINPVRFFMAALRAVFLKGAGLAELHHELSMLAIIGGVVFPLALVAFSRKSA